MNKINLIEFTYYLPSFWLAGKIVFKMFSLLYTLNSERNNKYSQSAQTSPTQVISTHVLFHVEITSLGELGGDLHS